MMISPEFRSSGPMRRERDREGEIRGGAATVLSPPANLTAVTPPPPPPPHNQREKRERDATRKSKC